MHSAQEILAMNDRQLFPDIAGLDSAFRQMARVWHPDHNHASNAAQVFAHITQMRDKAKHRGVMPSVLFERANGSSFKMEYLRAMSADGCGIYIGGSSVAYLVDAKDADLADRAQVRKWSYANSGMKTEMERFLPNQARYEELIGGRLFVYRRTPDQVLMRDLMTSQGPIAPEHVCWMVTRMMNIACYLEYAGVSHLSLSPDFLLVSLEHHGVSLTGPTLYATTFDKRPLAATKRTIEAIPSLRDADSKADSRLDRQLIRQTALELLGDPSGNRIRSNPNIRPEVVRWLSGSPPLSAVADYESWEKSLGVRKFVKYPKTAQDIYAAI